MSKQYEHIRRIRNDKYWLDDSSRRGEQNPLLKDLQQSINKLSRDLYRKDSHFLLELIQNAEDNDYDCNNPDLSFTLVKSDPSNSNASRGALVISNNETGFSESNMEAMCSIGSSFKEKLKGYIGEKGIGFKSVFKVTKSPYIYSNGYRVRFQDEINEIGLGYIVPEWVENVPKVATNDHTTIILPLNNGKIGFSEVSRMMSEFTPETILFLSKIRQLRFHVEGEYDISISKSIENKHVVILTITTTVDDLTSVTHKEYLLYTKNYERPADLLVEGREDVLDRDITVSFPIGNTANDGAIYAYLPVIENTGMPFILNADFLVPGSRDMINEDSEWNEWLLKQIPELFVEAFTEFIKISQYRYELFSHIPIESKLKATYFEPIIKPIINSLAMLPIIPTVPNGKFVIPSVAKSSRDFRKAISGLKLPSPLKERLVTDEFQNTISSDVAQSLGILGLKSRDVIACLNEEKWIRDIGYDGLIKVFRYLSSGRKNYDVGELRRCRILPIKEKKKVIFSCVAIQPIYLEADKHDIEVLKEKPSCIKVPVRFLDKQFYDLVKNEDDIIEWLKDVLFAHPFSLEKYAVDTTKWFCANHSSLTAEQFIETSNYILDHSSGYTQLYDFPILLSDGQRMLFSNGMYLVQELVTPAGMDPDSGWQLVFSSQDDRKHFLVLSDLYIRDNEKVPKIVTFTKATRNPPLHKSTLYPRQYGWNSWETSNDYTHIEKKALDEAYHRSAVSRKLDIYISRVHKPSGLSNDLSDSTSVALIRWLNGRYKNSYHSSIAKDLQTEIGWYNYGRSTKQVDSEITDFLRNVLWLPSTKGMQKPSHVFKKNIGIYDVLGDTVPYFEHDLNEVVSNFLGIRVELSNYELISFLKDLSSSNEGNIQMAERIYSALNSREIDGKVKDQLTSSDCIAVLNDGNVNWVSPKVCVWKDRSDMFESDFYFLSNLYPKLKNFFLDVLDVALDIGDEQFCELWLDIQRRECIDIIETEDKLTMLYHRLKPLFDSSDNSSAEWWDKYLSQAMLWSSSKRFVKTYQVYIPDNGILKDVFVKEQVDYLWYPKGSSYSQWESLHWAFKLRSLKDSVSISLKDVENSVIVNPAKYLTRSAKTLILVWLREKHPERFQSLVDKGIVNEFVRTTEYRSDKLIISYELDGRVVEASSDAFIDISNGKAYYVATACKPAIAAEICRALSVNEHGEDLESWIKGVLGSDEAEIKAELKQKNWQITNEILQLLSEEQDSIDSTDENSFEDKQDDALDDDPDIDELGDDLNPDGGIDPDEEGKRPDGKGRSDDYGSGSHKSGKRQKNRSEPDADNADEDSDDVDDDDSEESIEDAIGNALNSDDKPKQDDGDYEDSGKTHNPDSRYDQEFNNAADRNDRSRKQTERFRILRRRILDGPDSQVREMLYRWYSGKCQICESNFYQSNGKPFFVSHYLVLRKVSDAADTVGNAVCLCANHFAQMLHGRVKSPDVLEQLSSIDPSCESFDLNLTFDGVPHAIRYNQKHAIALKAFYESIKES